MSERKGLSKRTRFAVFKRDMSRYGLARQFKYFCGVCWNRLGGADE